MIPKVKGMEFGVWCLEPFSNNSINDLNSFKLNFLAWTFNYKHGIRKGMAILYRNQAPCYILYLKNANEKQMAHNRFGEYIDYLSI